MQMESDMKECGKMIKRQVQRIQVFKIKCKRETNLLYFHLSSLKTHNFKHIKNNYEIHIFEKTTEFLRLV